MKKKIFALLLVVLMLVPFVVACGGSTNTNTETETNTNTNTDTSNTENPGNTDEPETPVIERVDTKTDKSQKWSGQTLDAIAGGWGQDSYGQTGPWSQPELYVSSATDDKYMGATINGAVWARQFMIKETYGVTVKWHQAKSNTTMQNELQTGLEAGMDKFHIAIPRAYEAQSLISANTVYDLANSKYIDLTKSYYNQAAVESFSTYGHTFYVAGDFSYLDEYTSFVIFYNQALSDEIGPTFGNLYNRVRDGKWTIAELAKKSALVGSDSDDEQGWQDTDTYGFGSGAFSTFFQSSNINQVSIDKSSGDKNQYEYRISLADNQTNVSSLVTQLVNIRSSTWARTSWDGGYGAMLASFTSGKLLFYHEVTQKIFEFPAQDENFKVAVLPMPKLNEEQENYATPFASQATVMCVPKATTDREMSEYFFDVLSWSGQDYIMRAFYLEMEARLYDDGETSREDALEVLKDYVFTGLSYDPGYMHANMGQVFMSAVQTETINTATSSSSNFTTLYSEAYNEAYDRLNNPKTGWNTYSKNYKD